VREKAWDQAVVLEILVDVERVEELGVEAGEEHVYDDGDVDFFLVLYVSDHGWELLILDALLDVLVIEVEVVDVVVRAVPLVVVGDDDLERRLLALGSCRLSSFSWGRSSWICWTSLLPSAGGEKTAAIFRGTKSGSAAWRTA